MQDQNHPNRSVKDRTFHFNYRIMYTGRYSDDKSEELHSIVVKGKEMKIPLNPNAIYIKSRKCIQKM